MQRPKCSECKNRITDKNIQTEEVINYNDYITNHSSFRMPPPKPSKKLENSTSYIEP
jgi:hypothetical protein